MKYLKLYLLLIVAGFFIASSGGRNDNRAGAPGDSGTCASCHSGAATNSGVVNLIGLPAEFLPGQSYDFQIQVTEPDAGTLVAAGFQLVATNSINNVMIGSFTAIDPGTRINPGGRLVQDEPLNYVGTTATWDVRYTAPTNPALYQNVNFFYAANSANLNGNINGDVVYSNATSVVLPVTWGEFTSKSTDLGNYLNWTTFSERQNDYFSVQRSDDGVEFKEIGRVEGNGYSSVVNTYEFLDSDFSSSKNYYRIKQVDFNGEYEYSDVLLIEKESKVLEIDVYPTLVQDVVNVSSNSDITVRLINSNGQLLSEYFNQKVINMYAMDAGVYFLQCLSAENQLVDVKKIIKL